ncbi:Golgi-specific brefeldin A-resistance guanine nucleotide exchange factor 1 [Onthophagus taurus]|uniref:Golgi-specific brefeldin A-resistance guanine nucleotide exchange factor 1 n=1 Tax=Onthophagus taurus TaxID=166361 RepID=UPI0039BE5C64
MGLPGNGIFVVRGEMSNLMTAMRRSSRWTSHSHQDENLDPLMKSLQDLKTLLNSVEDLRQIEPIIFLNPFLDVIKSEDTTGPVTNLALSAVNKFLSYGLLDPSHSNILSTIKSIADSITRARFVGTDQSSDSIVLMKILQVLRTLTLSPEGASLTNENICAIMLSCFKICFETRLGELLRKTAELYLKDMVQLVFMRLPQFPDVYSGGTKFRMRPGAVEATRTKRKSRNSFRGKNKVENKQDKSQEDDKLIPKPNLTSISPNESQSIQNIVDMQGSISQENSNQENINQENTNLFQENMEKEKDEELKNEESLHESINNDDNEQEIIENVESIDQEYVNPRGIRFTPQSQEEETLIPYGLASVRELFRFLISLCNPMDRQNTEVMTQVGLSLLTVAFEVGADSIGKYSSLLTLVKDDLCRNLFSLLHSERISVFAADLQLSFLMFESLRTHLKFQQEFYLTKLIEIVVSESVKVTYEHKEIALDNILQLWRIPGLVTELYLNYDCDMYCTNLYEDLTKLLAKNAFPVTAGIYNTHLLSLDALLTVIESIEGNCNLKSDDGECFDDQNKVTNSNSRQKLSEKVPTRQELLSIKNIKKWLPTGTEYFNLKPKKGIQFLQEHGVLKPELDSEEIVIFLRENPNLDKKMIGEFISSRNNLQVLEAFVKMFDFTDTRIDEALRQYLETFRLPGEAPLISLILEHFAEHWHKCNGEPFADADAAFTLAYAIIMLNVDQHNHNVKKQSVPMRPEDFKKNLKKVNGNSDFDQDMLDDIYNAIKNEEIVMPAEQTGIVKENYLWKVLLRRGSSKDGVYIHANSGLYDRDLFQLIWGPVLSALSFVFERSEDPLIYKRAITGFERCAFISSHFGLTTNLDMLVLTLCKYTFLNNQPKNTNLSVQLGMNQKAQLALKSVFNLIHEHGANLREGWKNVFDLILTLYTGSLLPKLYVEAEDFIEVSGKIILIFKDVQSTLQKQESGLFSSLYSYMVSSENLSRLPSQEEQEYTDIAKSCLKECNLEQIISDSKFLHEESLIELVKSLIELSRGPEYQKHLGYVYNENVAVFFLELLLKIVIQNRDRVMKIWQTVRDHLYTVLMNASHCDYQFLLERSVIGLLRLAIRLMRNEEMSATVLQSLRMLLLLKPAILFRISRQISFGLYELLKTSAQNIHTKNDWSIIFTLLECVGAGAQLPKPVADENQVDLGTKSEGEGPVSSEEESVSDRGYTSDSELSKSPKFNGHRSTSPVIVPPQTVPPPQNNSGGWILVGNEGDVQPVVGRTLPPIQYGLALDRNLGPHDKSGLVKCCESLAFLVRDVAHITPYNFDDCVHCIRTFVEASLHGVKRTRRNSKRESRPRRKPRQRPHYSPVSSPDEDTESDEENLPSGYHQVCIQLLDLMHTLHTRTAQIFRWWAEEGGELTQDMSLWTQGWCPLLQGIARLCCDTRKQVRLSAISYLQRALLVHDLQTLSAPEWEACFHRVLFPLLMQLLEPIGTRDPIAVEETRMRAATVLSKVFLHHLTPLLSLPTFGSLWLTILDFMDRYMHAENSDVLFEAIPESLKNMLLVMESAKVFEGAEGRNLLWMQTWDRINKFLPNLKDELFKEREEIKNIESSNKNIQIEQPSQIEESTPKPTQHNIENATRSSIILQPTQNVLNSPLFAHLGQMVSTPIGPPETQQTTSNQQSPIKLNQINITSIPNSQGHTFPILYNSQEVQPSSLYTEYIQNPYNLNLQANDNNFMYGNVGTVNLVQNQDPTNQSQISNENVFQSANYFCKDPQQQGFIPPGSEILYQNVSTIESDLK